MFKKNHMVFKITTLLILSVFFLENCDRNRELNNNTEPEVVKLQTDQLHKQIKYIANGLRKAAEFHQRKVQMHISQICHLSFYQS